MSQGAGIAEELEGGWARMREELAALKALEAEWMQKRAELDARLEDSEAERMILSLELQAVTREREQARAEIERLGDTLEQRVYERTAQLEKACEEMKRLDEAKDAFLSSVSHEFRTPLTSVRSFSEILLTYEDVDRDQQREFLGIIHSESERLTRLINDLLDLSKIQAGRMTWHDDFLSPAEVLAYTVKAQEPLLREKSLNVSLELPPQLPLVFADRDRIQQIMVNLLTNAIKFSNPGGQIRIRAETLKGRRAGDNPEWIRVSVSDQGIGINKEDQNMIFEKFRQVTSDSLGDKPQGTGLGLPICKEILSHYQGTLWVESEKGQGSTFFFTLPAAPRFARIHDAIEAKGAVAGWKGRTVLVVDDNRNVRRMLRYQLERRGYTVLEAANGREALEVVRGAHVDLITLDLMMPVMSGYDFLDSIREDALTRAIPVLVISVVENGKESILPGANDYLRKPFREQDLIEKVNVLLGETRKPILVVDDEQAVVDSLCVQLQDKGFQVHVARDGDEAIALMKRRPPELVILDLLMPNKNGLEVLNWVRKEEKTRHIPVIILSGCALSGDTEGLLGLEENALIVETDDLNPLFTRIDALVSQPGVTTMRGPPVL